MCDETIFYLRTPFGGHSPSVDAVSVSCPRFPRTVSVGDSSRDSSKSCLRCPFLSVCRPGLYTEPLSLEVSVALPGNKYSGLNSGKRRIICCAITALQRVWRLDWEYFQPEIWLNHFLSRYGSASPSACCGFCVCVCVCVCVAVDSLIFVQ